MTTLVSEFDQVVTVGTAWIRLQANVPTEIPEKFVNACFSCGCKPADAQITQSDNIDEADNLGALVAAMIEILGTGDDSLLTTDGEPKHQELQKRVDFNFTKADRKAAWAIASGNDGDSE